MAATYRDLIRMVKVFASLSDAEIDKIASYLLERRYRGGQVVFEQGEEADALYIVESGRLKVTAVDAKGNKHILALYSQGDFFGEMALESGQSRSATISTVTDSVVLVLRKEDFETFVRNNYRVMRPLLEIIAERRAQNTALFANDGADDDASPSGKVITLCSPKGGVGRTTVAVNLAIALKEATDKRVALVDASPGMGGVGPLLGVVSDRSTIDLVSKVNNLNHALIEGAMYPHSSGVRVLLSPIGPDFSQSLTGYHMHMILAKLRGLFDYVVVDTSMSLDEGALAIHDVSDLIVLLTTIEAPGLKNVRAFLNATDARGYRRSKICLVANRADSTGGMTIDDAEAVLGQHFTAGIVSDGMLATHAGNKNTPIIHFDKKARMTLDLRNLADGAVALLDGRPVEISAAPLEIRRWGGKAKVAKEEQPKFRMQSIFHGLGIMFAVTISLLFVNFAIDFALKGTNGNYPYTAIVGVLLGSSVFVGSFLALRLDHGGMRGWSLGLILGLLYGMLTGMVTAAIGNLIADTIVVAWETVVFAIPAYGVLGLLGGIIGSIGRKK